MATSKITQDLVSTTYNDLKAEGINPSLDRIRERLGSGSKGTIQAHLKAYLADVAEKEANRDIQLPVNLADELKSALFQAAKDGKETITEQYKSVSLLLDESDLLRSELEEKIHSLESELKEKNQQLSGIDIRHAKDIAALEQRVIDSTQAKTESDDKLSAAIEKGHAAEKELAAAQATIAAQEKALSKLEADLSEIKEDNRNLRNI